MGSSCDLLDFVNIKISKLYKKQAGAELGQAQVQLKLELSLTWFKICCINPTTEGVQVSS